jgi:hypothetical protein
MRAGGMTQIVEHLPHNHKILSSNSSTAKKKKKKRERKEIYIHRTK